MTLRVLITGRAHPARDSAAPRPGAARGGRWRRLAAIAGGAALAGGLLAVPALGPAAAAARTGFPRPDARTGLRAACPAARRGHDRCFVLYRPQHRVNQAIAAGVRGIAVKPSGLSPKQVQGAYRLPASRQSHQTVAISIAYNTPHLASYLAYYRSYYGLPPCTTASSCLRIVNQHGQASPLPPSGAGSGWDLEATLDVSMISVACPHCKIIVAEASNTSTGALAETETAAARLGAQVISNSYGQRENGAAQADARSYDHPGHTIVVAAGDYGFTAANFPANLATVTAVGGTELTPAHNPRGWSESIWNSQIGAGGSGCSAYVPQPSWQRAVRHWACPGRTVADVSAVASNVPIYNTVYGGWVTVAGTSIAAPLIAGIYGLAGNGATVTPAYPYAHRTALFDIQAGNNAGFGTPEQLCGRDYLCVAKPGYDAPSGLGTPDGTGAF